MSKKTASETNPETKSSLPLRSSARTAAKPPPIPGVKPPPIPGVRPPPIPGAKAPSGPSSSRAPASTRPGQASRPPSSSSPGRAPPRPSTRPSVERAVAIESLGLSLAELKTLVATIAADVDRVRSLEGGLSEAGREALADIALRLRGAVGVPTPKGPPPLPASPAAPKTRPVALSTLDISEMAELVDSLAPPPLPEIVVDDEWST